jgi:hypothetical protein
MIYLRKIKPLNPIYQCLPPDLSSLLFKLPIDWCPLFPPFLIPTLIIALGWQAILIHFQMEFFGIDNGSPIMANNHPAIVEMLEQPIIGALQIPQYAELHGHLQLCYFLVSISSWRTSLTVI